jgi:hypothetical protein
MIKDIESKCKEFFDSIEKEKEEAEETSFRNGYCQAINDVIECLQEITLRTDKEQDTLIESLRELKRMKRFASNN